MRFRVLWIIHSDIVPGISAILKGNPVGEAEKSVLTFKVPLSPACMIFAFRSGRIPDSFVRAKRDPACMPVAHNSRAFISPSGEA